MPDLFHSLNINFLYQTQQLIIQLLNHLLISDKVNYYTPQHQMIHQQANQYGQFMVKISPDQEIRAQ